MNPTSNKYDLEQIFQKYGKIVDIWVSDDTIIIARLSYHLA